MAVAAGQIVGREEELAALLELLQRAEKPTEPGGLRRLLLFAR